MTHQQYDNTGKGALFVNNRKQSDKHPDMNGKINVNGVDYYLSGWWKQTAKGEILSLSLGQPVEQRQEQAPQAARGRGRPQPVQQHGGRDIDDDIPF
jgi:hypothetical protein